MVNHYLNLRIMLYTLWDLFFAITLVLDCLPAWISISSQFHMWYGLCWCWVYKDVKFWYNKLQELVVKPWALLMSNPFARQMSNFGCLHLNQYHHESLGYPFWNEVGRVWVTFATFHLNCYSVMESPHSYILKTHVIIASSYYFVNTHGGPIFLLLVFPYRWLENEVTNMYQNLLAPHKKVIPFSTTSKATYNDSLEHLLLRFVPCMLFVLVDLCIVFDIVWKGTFSLFDFGQSNIPLRLPWGTLSITRVL